MPLTLIVNLDVADEIILNRISERYVHLPSGRVYNSSFNRPKVDGLDDVTGEPLTKRPDDNPVSLYAHRHKIIANVLRRKRLLVAWSNSTLLHRLYYPFMHRTLSPTLNSSPSRVKLLTKSGRSLTLSSANPFRL